MTKVSCLGYSVLSLIKAEAIWDLGDMGRSEVDKDTRETKRVHTQLRGHALRDAGLQKVAKGKKARTGCQARAVKETEDPEARATVETR